MTLKFKWREKLVLILFIASYGLTSCNETSTKSVSKERSERSHVDTVILKQMQFSPATLNVSKGDTVVWINQDLVDHDITSNTSKLFYSDTLKVGNSWKHVITDSASYHCSIHPSMIGKITLK
ncbi:MAG: plastocyanin/azurin family copper-binding protein [Ginsengibacter sp.]